MPGVNKYEKSIFAISILMITLLITSLVPAVIGESSGGGNQYLGQGGNGDGGQDDSPGVTSQEQAQNKTCDGNGTQTQAQEQDRKQAQNQTCDGNGTQTQAQEQDRKQVQDQTCDGNGTQAQAQEQDRKQVQDQTCDGNGTQEQNKEGMQEQKGSASGDGAGSGEMYQWRHQYRNEIQNAINNGTLTTELTLMKQDGTMVQETNHYQLGMDTNIEKAEGNVIRIRVTAEYKEGKVVAINIENRVLAFGNMDDMKVFFDGSQIQMGSVDEIINAQGSEAKYIGAVDSQGAQVLVYIPHFSEHVIEIRSLTEIPAEKIFTTTNIVAMAVGIVVIIGLAVHVYTIGKSRKF